MQEHLMEEHIRFTINGEKPQVGDIYLDGDIILFVNTENAMSRVAGVAIYDQLLRIPIKGLWVIPVNQERSMFLKPSKGKWIVVNIGRVGAANLWKQKIKLIQRERKEKL